MLLDTTNGHNSAIVDKFNKLAEKFDSYGLLEIILKDFCDDQDLQEIINILEERMERYKEEKEVEENENICECGGVGTTFVRLIGGVYCDECILALEKEGYY
jgi:hypothetical protein